MKMIKARLLEASTWGGISALLLANTVLLGDEYRQILGILALITGSIAVLLKDPASSQ